MKPKKILAIIPARGGSKGLTNKTLRHVNGVPLIINVINSAKKSRFINDIIVTSDSDEILKTSKSINNVITYKRASELSQDNSKMIDVVLDVLNSDNILGNYDIFILLQPTSPLRTSTHIDEAIEKYLNSKSESLVSSYEVDNKYFKAFYVEKDFVIPLSKGHINNNRQQNPKLYMSNGAIYIVNIEVFIAQKSFLNNKTLNYIMNIKDSVDIDTLEDLQNANKLLLNE